MSSLEAPASDSAKKIISSQSAGYLLGKFGLIIVSIILVISVWFGQTIIAILLGLILSTAGLSWLWSRLSLAGVSCQRALSELRAFPEEDINLKLRLINRKLLPLPWIQIDDRIPASFASDNSLLPGEEIGYSILSRSTSLLWYTGINWQYRLYCRKRGYYQLGPLTVTSGDIFGFYRRSFTVPMLDHVIVYPRIYNITRLSISSLYPMGETRAEQHIFEDPSRTIGVRDYCSGDSLRRIHWKASARHNELKVRIFEATTTLKVAIFLAADSFQSFQSIADYLELGISAAASLANYLSEQRNLVGLFSNSKLADSHQPVRIPPGSGAAQLVTILESLAKITAFTAIPFSLFFEDIRKDLPMGTTLIFVFSKPPVSFSGVLSDLKDNGYKVLVLQIGDEEKTDYSPEIPWCNIKIPGDLALIGAKEEQ